MLLLTAASGGAAQQAPAAPLGRVHFDNSCVAAVQPQFDRAMALLHSFEFAGAIAAFKAVLAGDPACGIAEWGIALAEWDNPFSPAPRSAAQLQAGAGAIARARALGIKTERERAFVDAAAALYADADTVAQESRLRAYRDAMAVLAARDSADGEAAAFHALAQLVAADPADLTYRTQLAAAATLERLFTAQPDHPGVSHYLIHSYDFEALAAKGLAAAHHYAAIAPSAAHALHMPSHVYTLLGLWQESIETNQRSADAARADRSPAEELHALDYQVYAFLQTAQDRAARLVMNALPAARARVSWATLGSGGSPAAYALAAIPARYALERDDWPAAATLRLQSSDFPFADALTHFGRAVGAARLGRRHALASELASLAKIQAGLESARSAFWSAHVGIQQRVAAAWLALLDGQTDAALTGMRAAAEAEEGMAKGTITPGPLVPARELLADMLMHLNRPADARTEYLATLRLSPKRFRSIAGAMRASSQLNDRAALATYAGELVAIGRRADSPPRRTLAEARDVRR